MRVVKIEAKVRWKIIRSESNRWIGVCEPLQLTVQSETWMELMEDIGETIDAMFQDLLKTNELDGFLREHGWAAHPMKKIEPVKFDVPFFPEMVDSRGSTQEVLG